jgi:hypothetical protein
MSLIVIEALERYKDDFRDDKSLINSSNDKKRRNLKTSRRITLTKVWINIKEGFR